MIKLEFIGNVGQDAQLATSNDGKKVVNFTCAINQGKLKDGTERPPLWIGCAIWYEKEREAKLVEFLKKGTKVYVSGTPRAESYIDQQGKPVAALKVIVNQIELLSAKQDSSTSVSDKEAVKSIVETIENTPF